MLGVKKIENPFLLKDYVSPEYFCNREIETENIIKYAQNGLNTSLISIRRLGKTGLLHHVLHQFKSKKIGIGIYVDMYGTTNLRDFTNQIATGIINAFPEKDPFWKKAFQVIKKLRPIMSINELSGLPELSLDYSRDKQFENTLMDLFNFLEAQEQPILVLIDEFQQIASYPEKNMEAILRTKIQTLKNVHFVFSGSSPHLLTEMFYSYKRPFYQSTQALFLKKIEREAYQKFIIYHFEKNKKTITEDALDFIFEFTKTHTFYTQFLCHRIYLFGGKKITLNIAHKQAMEILKLNEEIYFQYRNMLTPSQWKLLKAIAKEDKVEQITSAAFLKKYDLGAASTVKRSLNALLKTEMIYVEQENDRKNYVVYNCFFSRWLQYK
ncbi:MAG: ATP-binding protein [Flavobacteriia bacterium]|nr:ATP-binding protein [Flavobacteriia bacterium]